MFAKNKTKFTVKVIIWLFRRGVQRFHRDTQSSFKYYFANLCKILYEAPQNFLRKEDFSFHNDAPRFHRDTEVLLNITPRISVKFSAKLCGIYP